MIERGRGKPGQEDARRQVSFVGGLAEPLLAHLLAHGLQVEAPTVVRDHHFDLRAAERGRQRDPPLGELAGGLALVGRLDAMIHGVADQMVQRVSQTLEDRAVQLDLAPLDQKFDLFAARPGQVAHQPVEALAGLGERQHPQPSHRVVEEVGHLVELAAVARQDHGKTLQVLLEAAQIVVDLTEHDRRGAGQQPPVAGPGLRG